MTFTERVLLPLAWRQRLQEAESPRQEGSSWLVPDLTLHQALEVLAGVLEESHMTGVRWSDLHDIIKQGPFNADELLAYAKEAHAFDMFDWAARELRNWNRPVKDWVKPEPRTENPLPIDLDV